MKKITYYLLITLLSVFALTSCGEDEPIIEDPTDKFVGTWTGNVQSFFSISNDINPWTSTQYVDVELIITESANDDGEIKLNIVDVQTFDLSIDGNIARFKEDQDIWVSIDGDAINLSLDPSSFLYYKNGSLDLLLVATGIEEGILFDDVIRFSLDGITNKDE